MRRVTVLAVAGLVWAASTNARPRVILVSWDGAGFAMTSRLLAEGRMPNLTRMLREGAWTDGMVSSFPTKTAAAHAVLFTGYYGHQSGITGNSVLMLPASLHDRLETLNGYFSTALRVDPVWVRVARSGLDAYALHATQAYPFETGRRDLDADERRHLFLIHGYTEVQERGETWNERSAPLEFPSGWAIPKRTAPRRARFVSRWGTRVSGDFSSMTPWIQRKAWIRSVSSVIAMTPSSKLASRREPKLGFRYRSWRRPPAPTSGFQSAFSMSRRMPIGFSCIALAP